MKTYEDLLESLHEYLLAEFGVCSRAESDPRWRLVISQSTVTDQGAPEGDGVQVLPTREFTTLERAFAWSVGLIVLTFRGREDLRYKCSRRMSYRVSRPTVRIDFTALERGKVKEGRGVSEPLKVGDTVVVGFIFR